MNTLAIALGCLVLSGTWLVVGILIGVSLKQAPLSGRGELLVVDEEAKARSRTLRAVKGGKRNG